MTKEKKSPNVAWDTCKAIVGTLVENPNWPRELKLAKSIQPQFPDIRFWKSLEYKKFPSLTWIIKNNQELYYISEKYLKFIRENVFFTENPKNEIGENKVGEDYKMSSLKPKNVLEFIN